MRSKFTFVGELVFPKENSKRPFFREWLGGKDGNIPMVSLNFGIKTNNSLAFVEAFGMKSEKIYSMNNEFNKIEIPWDDRENSEILASVAAFKKHFVNIEPDKDVEEFISEYDMICYLKENLENVTEKIRVIGYAEKEPYMSKQNKPGISNKYIIQNVYAVSESSKSKLQIDYDFYYNKDSVDDSDFKSDKKIVVDGYIRQYLKATKSIEKAIGEAHREFFIPHSMILSGEKLNLEEEQDKVKWDIRMDELNVPSSKKMYHCLWKTSLISGAEEIEFDESQLTSKQKRAIKCGISELEDFKPNGGLIGPRIHEIRLVSPIFKGEFADGVIESEYSMKEFEENLMKFKEPENIDKVLKEMDKSEGGSFDSDNDDDFDDDFS